MSELLLVGNPARRKSRKPRSAAQRAATRRMVAANRARRNPAKRRAAPRKAAITIAANPRRRRRSVSARRTRRVRRNPIGGGSMRGITAALKNAGMGAAGALGVDVAYGFAASYLPESVQSPTDATGGTNFAYFLAKGAAAVALGMLAKKIVGASKAAQFVEGSLTVTLHDAAKQMIGSTVTLGRVRNPARLAGVGMYPGASNVMALPRNSGAMGLGRYVSGVSGNSRERAMNVR